MPSVELLIDDLLASLPPNRRTTDARDLVLRELGWALVAEGQLFLDASGRQHDVELFFETYGYPRHDPPAAWVGKVAGGLGQRLSDDEWDELAAKAITRAAGRLAV